MTAYEPHTDNPAPKDGDRVRVGEGPVEGTWNAYLNESPAYEYAGWVAWDSKRVAIVKGVPVTVLRPVECDHLWNRTLFGEGIFPGYYCAQCDTAVARLVPEREPVDLDEAVQVFIGGGFRTKDAVRAVLEWAGVPVKDEPS